MEKTIAYEGDVPSWDKIRDAAGGAGLDLKVRMIDNLPAFPDELPEPGWTEVRVSTSAGMMTLRNQPGKLQVVVWGNAEEALQGAWQKLAEACAKAVGGQLAG